jgi:hypothetical protein
MMYGQRSRGGSTSEAPQTSGPARTTSRCDRGESSARASTLSTTGDQEQSRKTDGKSSATIGAIPPNQTLFSHSELAAESSLRTNRTTYPNKSHKRADVDAHFNQWGRRLDVEQAQEDTQVRQHVSRAYHTLMRDGQLDEQLDYSYGDEKEEDAHNVTTRASKIYPAGAIRPDVRMRRRRRRPRSQQEAQEESRTQSPSRNRGERAVVADGSELDDVPSFPT